ncbi:MAG: hypothetical protein ABSA65_09645 [Acidimicrobiales bacterium]
MIRSCYRLVVGGFAGALALGSVSALPSMANLRQLPGGASSVAAEAKAINMKVSDLPTSIKWATAQPAASPKGEAALGRQAVACIAKGGPVSPDPFGTSGVTGGTVLVDVSSPTFFEKSATLTHLPSASSEVVFLNSASGTLADLAALGRKASIACLATQMAAESTLQGAGKGVKASGSFMGAPRYGSGGVHIRFLETGGNFALLKETLYDDEYFYVQGSAEVFLTFVDLGSAFSSSGAASAIAAVMARAKSEVGKG